MQQANTKVVQDQVQLSGEGASPVIVQDIKFWTNNQIVYAQTRILSRERDS